MRSLPALLSLTLAVATSAGCEPKPRSSEPSAEREPPTAPSAEEWNYPAVPWSSPAAALKRMEATDRPGLVMIKADWCSRCKELQRIFTDPKVIALAKGFELILIDQDVEPDYAARWARDGQYVPRTYFLRPDGSVDESRLGPSPRYQHFFPAERKEDFMATMTAATGAKR